jgi:predicted enzyme related to lactoylglutathione lyase
MGSYGTSGALVKMDRYHPGGNSTIVYFHCDDCAVEEGRAAGSGGKVQQSKMSIGEYGCISLVLDSEGNIIGLHSMQ